MDHVSKSFTLITIVLFLIGGCLLFEKSQQASLINPSHAYDMEAPQGNIPTRIHLKNNVRRLQQANKNKAPNNLKKEVKNALEKLYSQYNNKKPLNILSLGGSVTFGAMLDDPSTQTYAALLNADNRAIRATGANYPSLCIESLIGKDIEYDVILLEFTLNGTPGLPLLLSRLRRRFPRAVFVYVHLYSLCIETRDEQGRSPFERGNRDPKVRYYWNSRRFATDQFFESYIKKHVFAVGGEVYELPRHVPPMEGLAMFSSDWHHLSERGHLVVARGVIRVLEARMRKEKKKKDRGGAVVVGKGDWGDGDECASWFYDGNVPLQYHGATVFQISDTKYTLQFPSKGDVELINHKAHPVPLYISFMTFWSNYPITEVTVNNGNSKTIIPHNTKIPHHITRTEQVGMAKPGKNIITFDPRPGSVLNFRLTAVIMCGECEQILDDQEQVT